MIKGGETRGDAGAHLARAEPPAEAKAVPSASVLRRFLATAPSRRAITFVRVDEAAATVAVDPRTVRRWVEAGRVEAAFVGGRYWICRDSLAAFLEKTAER